MARTTPSPKCIGSDSLNASVPYHGASEVHAVVRRVIASHAPGDMVVMSARIMVDVIVAEGHPPWMAQRLYSQIRKGAPLHEEWAAAFACGKFFQNTGRGKPSSKSISVGTATL